MKAVVQRVKKTTLSVEGELISEIPFGLTVFLGVKVGDTEKEAAYLAKKIAGLRIFEDENGKTNLALKDVDGDLLLISQFTLYADCKKGNRPSFVRAGKPDAANEMYQYIIKKCKEEIPVVEQGIFGADMKISLLNDGPFTIILDSNEIC